MKKTLTIVLISPFLLYCTQHSVTEVYHSKRSNVVNVQDKVHEIAIEDDVLLNEGCKLCIMGDYLIIQDFRAYDKYVHIFDSSTYQYLASTADRGEGPDEILNAGVISINEGIGKFYIPDHSKLLIYSFDMDSVLHAPSYKPSISLRMSNTLFPRYFQCLNDTLAIASVVKPTSNFTYDVLIGRFNLLTGEISMLPYENPKVKTKRHTEVAVSEELNEYVACYRYADLMTIGTLDGQLKRNIYGPKWNAKNHDGTPYYRDVLFCNGQILVLWDEGTYHKARCTKLMAFTAGGDYLNTFELGHNIYAPCFDKKRQRILFATTGEMQFGYVDLEDLGL